MIKFALRCDEGHEFESWFQDGAAFDAQTRSDLIRCPVCGSVSVSKAIMAPALARRCAAERRALEAKEMTAAEPAKPEAGPVLISSADAGLRAAIGELRRHIVENTDDLGDKFVEEAWKIHHGEAPDRAIRGQASLEEARLLMEDGVLLTPLPRAPEEFN